MIVEEASWSSNSVGPHSHCSLVVVRSYKAISSNKRLFQLHLIVLSPVPFCPVLWLCPGFHGDVDGERGWGLSGSLTVHVA